MASTQTDGDFPKSCLARSHCGGDLAVAVPLERVAAKSEAQPEDGSGSDGLLFGPSIPGYLAN